MRIAINIRTNQHIPIANRDCRSSTYALICDDNHRHQINFVNDRESFDDDQYRHEIDDSVAIETLSYSNRQRRQLNRRTCKCQISKKIIFVYVSYMSLSHTISFICSIVRTFSSVNICERSSMRLNMINSKA